jgi:hypothetical protein
MLSLRQLLDKVFAELERSIGPTDSPDIIGPLRENVEAIELALMTTGRYWHRYNPDPRKPPEEDYLALIIIQRNKHGHLKVSIQGRTPSGLWLPNQHYKIFFTDGRVSDNPVLFIAGRKKRRHKHGH